MDDTSYASYGFLIVVVVVVVVIVATTTTAAAAAAGIQICIFRTHLQQLHMYWSLCTHTMGTTDDLTLQRRVTYFL